MERDEIKKILCSLHNAELEEFNNISMNQPVPAGSVIGKYTAHLLVDKGLCMHYEGEYVLTDKGTELKNYFIEVATKIRDSGILYKKQ